MMQPFERLAIIGLGLLGGSVGLAVREYLPGVATTGYDADPDTRACAAARITTPFIMTKRAAYAPAPTATAACWAG